MHTLDVLNYVADRLTATRPRKSGSDVRYMKTVKGLWKQKHREEKYIALLYAKGFKRFIPLDNMDLYEDLIRSGSWWDFVDSIAVNCVGYVFKENREALIATIQSWNKDDDFWIRRVSILCQLKHKTETDEALLFEICSQQMYEKEFFIRKVIGWAVTRIFENKCSFCGTIY